MSAIKDGRYPIMLDKERHLLFSLNVLDELQDKAGGFDKLNVFLSGKNLFKNLKWLLTILINEGAEDGEKKLSECEVGKLIHAGNLPKVKDAIFKAFSKGSTGDELQENNEEAVGEEDIEKNLQSRQAE